MMVIKGPEGAVVPCNEVTSAKSCGVGVGSGSS